MADIRDVDGGMQGGVRSDKARLEKKGLEGRRTATPSVFRMCVFEGKNLILRRKKERQRFTEFKNENCLVNKRRKGGEENVCL